VVKLGELVLQPPVLKKAGPRPGIVDHFETYLRERLAAYPALTADAAAA
jgi:hypothetical protein